MPSCLFCIFLIVLAIFHTHSLDTNVTLERTFDNGRGFISLVRGMYTLMLHTPDIRLTQQLTVEEAFHGVNKTIIVDRNIVNNHCAHARCSACAGRGYITHHHNNHIMHQHLTSPCPVCLGAGYHADSCPIYTPTKTIMLVSFPPNVTMGHTITQRGEGSEVITQDEIITGDVEIVVTDIRSGNYSLTPDGLQLKVTMTPQQALEGFIFEESYMHGRAVTIDRRNKTTLPDTDVTITNPKGHGIFANITINFELTSPPDQESADNDRELQQDKVMRSFLTALKRSRSHQ